MFVRPCVDVSARPCAHALVPLFIQHAMRMRHIVCGLSGSSIVFLLYLINGTIFEKKLLDIKCVF
jgi:hypothetical protein